MSYQTKVRANYLNRTAKLSFFKFNPTSTPKKVDVFLIYYYA